MGGNTVAGKTKRQACKKGDHAKKTATGKKGDRTKKAAGGKKGGSEDDRMKKAASGKRSWTKREATDVLIVKKSQAFWPKYKSTNKQATLGCRAHTSVRFLRGENKHFRDAGTFSIGKVSIVVMRASMMAKIELYEQASKQQQATRGAELILLRVFPPVRFCMKPSGFHCIFASSQPRGRQPQLCVFV